MESPIKHLHQATQIVLTLYNQKHSIRGDTVSQFKSDFAAACLVLLCVNIFLRLQDLGYNITIPVSNFLTAQGLRSVISSNIITDIRAKTQQLGSVRLGFFLEDIITHYWFYPENLFATVKEADLPLQSVRST